MGLPSARLSLSNAALGPNFVHHTFGPETAPLAGAIDGVPVTPAVKWSKSVGVEGNGTYDLYVPAGYYKLGISVTALSGDTDDILVACGGISAAYYGLRECQGVVNVFDSEYGFVNFEVGMTLGNTNASVRVSAWIYSLFDYASGF